jgi:hypothetical protein
VKVRVDYSIAHASITCHVPKLFTLGLFKVQTQVLIVDNTTCQVIDRRALGNFHVGLGLASLQGPLLLKVALLLKLCC